eukprot:334693-Rhodomonas_salina.2
MADQELALAFACNRRLLLDGEHEPVEERRSLCSQRHALFHAVATPHALSAQAAACTPPQSLHQSNSIARLTWTLLMTAEVKGCAAMKKIRKSDVTNSPPAAWVRVQGLGFRTGRVAAGA